MRSITALGVLVLAVAGCAYDNGSGVSYPPVSVATITLTASSFLLTSAGETLSITATVKDANGAIIRGTPLTWRTNAPLVATVDAAGAGGLVTAADDGTAVITAASGSVEGAIVVSVHRRLFTINLSGIDTVVTAGDSLQLSVSGVDARQQERDVPTGATFESSNPLDVTVSPNGWVWARFSPFQSRSATVTARVTRDGITLSATRRITVGDPAPAGFSHAALMLPELVRPVPVGETGQGIMYLTAAGDSVHFKMLWSRLSGPAVSAHIHGPASDGGVAPVLVDIPLGVQADTDGKRLGSFSAAGIRPQDGKPAISLDSLITLMGTLSSAYVDIHTARFADGEMRGPIGRVR